MSKYQNFNQKQLLICSIAWMNKYQGVKDDPPYSNARYVRETDHAYEENNFKEQNGQYHGYVNIPAGGAQLKIEKLGTTTEAAEVENITIIWIAPRPQSGESGRADKNFVVGWYRNATVCRYPRDNKKKQRMYTKTQNGHLIIPLDSRRLQFPDEFSLHSSVRYGDGFDGEIAEDFFKKLDNLMGQNPPVPLPQESGQESHHASSGRQNNPEVERAAIDYVTKHYEHQGYIVESVEQKNKGWDLEARKDGSPPSVLIEVKGLQDDKIDCTLTHNEYTKATQEKNFRLAVVTSALKEEPCLRILQFLPEKKEWLCLNDKSVAVEQKLIIGARISEK